MTSIDHTDLLNIKAISSSGTRLSGIMAYWDAVDRSYPQYNDFINSIKKLESLNAIEICDRGRYGKISNTLYRQMTVKERLQYFFTPTDKLILSLLERLTPNIDAVGLTISEQDYQAIIRAYYTGALK